MRTRGRRPTAAPGCGAAARGGRRTRAGRVGAVLALALLAGCAAASDPLPGPTGGDPTPAPTGVPHDGSVDPAGLGEPEDYAAALVAGTNRVRAAEGLPALTVSACAAEAATARARALVGAPDLRHAPLDPVLAACEPSTRAAENLGRAATPADRVVEAWMGSPGHRENLLSEALTELGVGCVPDGDVMLCSQVFLGP